MVWLIRMNRVLCSWMYSIDSDDSTALDVLYDMHLTMLHPLAHMRGRAAALMHIHIVRMIRMIRIDNVSMDGLCVESVFGNTHQYNDASE